MTSSLAGKAAVAQLGVGGSDVEVTDWFRSQLLAALADPMFNVPKDFLTWILDKVAVSGLNLPIGQIVGFSQFVIQEATEIGGNETTTSGSYTDLATVGPTLSGLPDGKYALFFGATVSSSSSGISAYMGLELNGTGPTTSTQLISSAAVPVQAMRVSVATLSSGNNDVTVKYKTDLGVTGTYGNRYLYALKIANA